MLHELSAEMPLKTRPKVKDNSPTHTDSSGAVFLLHHTLSFNSPLIAVIILEASPFFISSSLLQTHMCCFQFFPFFIFLQT